MLNKYTPYTKSDFRKYYINPDNELFYRYNIIRPLTEDEMIQYKDEDDTEITMYLIYLECYDDSDCYEKEVFAEEILKECRIENSLMIPALQKLLSEFEDDDEGLDEFIEKYKIEKFIMERI